MYMYIFSRTHINNIHIIYIRIHIIHIRIHIIYIIDIIYIINIIHIIYIIDIIYITYIIYIRIHIIYIMCERGVGRNARCTCNNVRVNSLPVE